MGVRSPAILTILTIGAWSGCHEPDRVAAIRLAEGEELPIIRQVQGVHSREDRPLRLVVRDAATLAQVPLVDVPVDFDAEMLLIVTLGRRLSDQYAVTIERVWREGGRLQVRERITAPAEGAPLSPASPFCVAVVPRCDLPVDDFSATVTTRSSGWRPSGTRARGDLPAN